MKPEKRLQEEIIEEFIVAMGIAKIDRSALQQILEIYHKRLQSINAPLIFRKDAVINYTTGFNLNLTVLELATLKIIYDDALYAIYDHNTMEKSARSILTKIDKLLDHNA